MSMDSPNTQPAQFVSEVQNRHALHTKGEAKVHRGLGDKVGTCHRARLGKPAGSTTNLGAPHRTTAPGLWTPAHTPKQQV